MYSDADNFSSSKTSFHFGDHRPVKASLISNRSEIFHIYKKATISVYSCFSRCCSQISSSSLTIFNILKADTKIVAISSKESRLPGKYNWPLKKSFVLALSTNKTLA